MNRIEMILTPKGNIIFRLMILYFLTKLLYTKNPRRVILALNFLLYYPLLGLHELIKKKIKWEFLNKYVPHSIIKLFNMNKSQPNYFQI